MNIVISIITIYFSLCFLILVVKACWGRAHKFSKLSKLIRKFLLPYDTLLSLVFTPFLIVDEIIKRF